MGYMVMVIFSALVRSHQSTSRVASDTGTTAQVLVNKRIPRGGNWHALCRL